jgi:RHS repeat-associated protein
MGDLDGTTAYVYDDLYRLTEVTYPDAETVGYSYDPMGNRTAMTSTVEGVITYTYDPADRLLTAGGDTFGWDATGRMITRTHGATTATYTYDPLDRLTRVVSDTTNVAFAYNGDGVRVGKKVNGTRTDYVQDVGGSLPVVVAETTAGQISSYVYGNDLLAQIDSTGNPTFYHHDGLGNVRALSDLAAQRTEVYDYAAFGEVRFRIGDTDQSFTFTGEQVDGELGLTYLRMRYYDAQLGRYLTRDPFEGFRDGTQSRNRYTYVENNPVTRIDPAGLTWQIFAGIEGGLKLGQVRVGGSGRVVLEPTGGLPDVYVTGGAGVKEGTPDPKRPIKFVPPHASVGFSYVGSGGVEYLPRWLRIKSGTLRLRYLKVGGKVGRDDYKIEVALTTDCGWGFDPNPEVQWRYKSPNLQGRLGDWIFDHFIQPRYDAEYNRIMAENHRRMLQIQDNAPPPGVSFGDLLEAGGAMGSPPSGGK